MWIKYAIGVLAALLIAVVYPTLEQRVVQPGEDAPSFSVTTDSGQKITESNFGGKVLVLNFWATWCAPCLEEFPALNRFAAQTKGSGVVVLGISIDHNEAQYKRFLQSTRPSFQTLRDADQIVNAKYGTFQFPETYVINDKGRVIKKYIGIIDSFPELEKLVKSL
jgi:cytochrome c biogenesis protein CcmG, thiol:disulfide interchange protein DsbE